MELENDEPLSNFAFTFNLRRYIETELAEACAPSHYNIGLLPW